MKKMLAAAGGLLLASSIAHAADTSVTLFGVIDEGLNYTNNVDGSSGIGLRSGYAAGSRFGLKGEENLGGGTSAVFMLESGFDSNNGKLGQGGRMFGRQLYVGLQDAQAGSLTMGRQYDSVVDFLGPLTSNGSYTGYLFAHPYDNDNTDNSFRVNNSIKYTSPNMGGLTFGGLYGFSNTTGEFSNNRLYSFGTSYVDGPLMIGAAYMNIDRAGNTVDGAVATNDANFWGKNQRIFGAGISYAIGDTTLGFVYTNSRIENPQGTVYVGALTGAQGLRFNNFEVNAKYNLTPSSFIQAMYTYTQGQYTTDTGKSSPKWHQIGLMFDQALSKRTDVYVQGVYQRVAGNSTGTFLDQAYITGADGSSSNNSQFVGRVAIRHAF